MDYAIRYESIPGLAASALEELQDAELWEIVKGHIKSEDV